MRWSPTMTSTVTTSCTTCTASPPRHPGRAASAHAVEGSVSRSFRRRAGPTTADPAHGSGALDEGLVLGDDHLAGVTKQVEVAVSSRSLRVSVMLVEVGNGQGYLHCHRLLLG